MPVSGQPFGEDTCKSALIYPTKTGIGYYMCVREIVTSSELNVTFEISAGFLNEESRYITKHFPMCSGDHTVTIRDIPESYRGRITGSGKYSTLIIRPLNITIKRCQPTQWYVYFESTQTTLSEVKHKHTTFRVNMFDNIVYTLPLNHNEKMKLYRLGQVVVTPSELMNVGTLKKTRMFHFNIILTDGCIVRCFSLYMEIQYDQDVSAVRHRWERQNLTRNSYTVSYVAKHVESKLAVNLWVENLHKDDCLQKNCVLHLSVSSSALNPRFSKCSLGNSTGFLVNNRCSAILLPSKNVTWEDANRMCIKTGSVLGFIYDKLELDALKVMTFYKYEQLLGRDIVYLGLHREVSKQLSL